MKSVFIIAIVAVVLIGVGIPNALGTTYVNDYPYEFSIDYPYGWVMQEEEYPSLVSFTDKYEWTTSIFVSHWENAGEQLTDDEEIDWMFEILEDQCNNNIVGTNGINCFNFQRYDDTAMVYEINGYRAITVMTSNTNQYGNPDYPGNYPMVWTFTHIYDGYDVWQISSESEDYVFDKHLDSIAELVESFRIGDATTSAPTFIPSSNTSYKIYFEELPEWSEFDVDSAVRDATNYWNDRDGITFSRTYDLNNADMYVSWIKTYGHNLLGTYIVGNIDVGLGDDSCSGLWQPYSQQTASETLTHEIGHHLGYDDLQYSPDTSEIMAYSNSNVSYEYEKWSETSMIGYASLFPVCTYENGITYNYKLTSDSNHTYDVFFVPSVTEYDKFLNGEDYRSACSVSDVRNTSGSCKVNSDWYTIVYVSGGSNDVLAEFELTLSETNLPGTSTTTSLPPITKNDTPLDYGVTQTITTSNDFFSAQGNDFTTITIAGFVPEQFVKNHLPVYLAITHQGVMIDELKVTTTSQGKFSVPFQLSPDASYGTYVITGRNSITTFGSTTFSYGISENITPPSVSSNFNNSQQDLGQNNLSEFTQFTSNHHGFSIDYPSNWSYEEDYECYDEDEVCMLSFADDLDYWSTSVNVNFYENYFEGYTRSSDNQYLEDLKAYLYDECINSIDYGFDFSCEDYTLHRADTMTINGLKSYVIEFSQKDVYDDGSYDNIHVILVEIPTGGDAAWNIYSHTLEEYSEYNLPLIKQSISSFIIHDVNTQESVSTPIQESVSTPIQESVSTPIQESENNMCGEGTIQKNGICVAVCGDGTVYQNGKCEVITTTADSSSGGGCLIATATYGSELAPQVQQLRELRDNQLLQTESGAAFMSTFNEIYYSFSPTIADMEREHPMFKEAVKLAITPMISSLSIMENAESESEVLGIGISVIVLNLGMYLGIPAITIVGLRRII